MVKNLPANTGHVRDPGSIKTRGFDTQSGRSPGKGNGYLLQDSY